MFSFLFPPFCPCFIRVLISAVSFTVFPYYSIAAQWSQANWYNYFPVEQVEHGGTVCSTGIFPVFRCFLQKVEQWNIVWYVLYRDTLVLQNFRWQILFYHSIYLREMFHLSEKRSFIPKHRRLSGGTSCSTLVSPGNTCPYVRVFLFVESGGYITYCKTGMCRKLHFNSALHQ